MAALVLHDARLAGIPERRNLVLVDGYVRAICDDQSLHDFVPARVPTLDLAGRVVTAGLTDSHIHPVMGIDVTAGVDLSHCRDLSEARSLLATAKRDEAGWIVGWGLDPNCVGGMPVTNAALREALGSAPAILRLFDAHSALASDEALRLAGITGDREFASRSRIVCDEGGRPTGLLLEEEAIGAVEAVMPTPSFVQRRAQLRQLLDAMAATGLCGGHVMDANTDSIRLYQSLDEADELPLRLQVMPWRRPEDDGRRVAEILDMQRLGGRLWQIAGAKLFIDGTIDNGTAWLDEPDCHGDSTAPYWRDPGDYTRAVTEFARHGVQTATHAIGDAAVAHVIRTIANLPAGSTTIRHRIEHIETLPDSLVPGFVDHQVIASMQPSHGTRYTRGDHTDNWSRRLGAERANRAWRCRDLYDAGVVVTLGSDWPIAPFDPRITLADAQLRRPWDRPDLPPVAPAQALTARQALDGYTTAPAVASCDRRLGRVATGYRADLTVWAEDPLAVPPDQLPQLPIDLTVVDGVVRYHDEVIT